MSLPVLEYPTYETKLISKQQKVEFRPFLVKEHKLLMMLKNADGPEIARIIKNLVNACTFGKLDVENMPYFDIEYLFLQIRSKSIGEIVDVSINCKCGNKVKTSYNIEDLKVDQTENHTNQIKITPTTGLMMKYPSIEHAIKLFEESDDVDVMDDLIISSIESIYDKENVWYTKDLSKEEIKEFIDNLQKHHFDMIENFFVSSPQIVQEIKATCNQCESDLDVKLKGLYNFFV